MARKNNEELNDQVEISETGVNIEQPKKEDVKEESKTIEVWKKELKIKDWIFVGLCTFMNWASGKSVTKKEFEEHLNCFLNAKIGG
ncbi:MAG: hypothetical protein A2Y41_07860 [Spirochaetes bacterium GWB1_36_13]|nr:MAG: hypothetical protein A2Y41_07860 [Spirochaetes bacterium GWB1_36_13]